MSFTFKNFNIQPDLKEVLRYMGIPHKESAPPNVLRVVEKAWAEAHSLIAPEGMFALFDIAEFTSNKVIVGESEAFSGKGILSLLEGCEKAAIIGVTIGEKLSIRAKEEMAKGNLLYGLAFDGIGSEAAEKSADFINEKICEFARKNRYAMTQRYSPGYCDFELQEQAVIFRLLPLSNIGISLTENHYLLPEKSITAVLGLKEGEFKRLPHRPPCNRCDRKDCSYRIVKS